MRYKIALQITDEGYSVSVPGLPGCWSPGAAGEEALANIRVATKGCLEACDELRNSNRSRHGRNASSCVITFVAVLSLTFVPTAIAQERSDPMAVAVEQRFTMLGQSFVSLSDAMPAVKYGFKPTNGAFMDARTFGEQVKHVACGNFAFFNETEKKEPPPGCATGGPSPAKTKAELVTYLRESFDYAQSVLRMMTPANALDPAGGPYGGKSTRLGLTTLALWHASDHYGQLVMYLRMNGIVPPASRLAPSR